MCTQSIKLQSEGEVKDLYYKLPLITSSAGPADWSNQEDDHSVFWIFTLQKLDSTQLIYAQFHWASAFNS